MCVCIGVYVWCSLLSHWETITAVKLLHIIQLWHTNTLLKLAQKKVLGLSKLIFKDYLKDFYVLLSGHMKYVLQYLHSDFQTLYFPGKLQSIYSPSLQLGKMGQEQAGIKSAAKNFIDDI